MTNICCFCSSSKKIHQEFHDVARDLGKEMAKNGHALVYGGGDVGLMGDVSNSINERGGKIIGIIPKKLMKVAGKMDETHVVENLRQRIDLMERKADAFLTLPGGIGTIHEFFDLLAAKQLGFHNKPIVLLNINNFFKNIIDQVNVAIELEFVAGTDKDLFFVANSVNEALDYIKNYKPKEFNIQEKINFALNNSN